MIHITRMQNQREDTYAYEPCVIECVFWLSNIINGCNDCLQKIYDDNDCIHDVVDATVYMTEYTCKACSSNIEEPMERTWISKNTVDLSNNKLICEYVPLNNFEIDELNDHFLEFSVHRYFKDMNRESKDDLIIFKGYNKVKKESYYICVRLFVFINIFQIHFSKVGFLSVTYTNGEHRSITLVVDKQWLVIGNELFGYTHILRMLEHQGEPFHFSMDYVLNIIDTDINVFELRSDKYLKIGRDGYTINPI